MPGKITIINIVSIKGGVGKTVIALALAKLLTSEHSGNIGRVLYLDTDFSGTCTRSGLLNESFDRSNWRGPGDFHFLEDLISSIDLTGLKKDARKYFERFPNSKDKLWLAFSSENHETIRKFSHFMDMEQYTNLILSRLLDLSWHALQDVEKDAVIILDNGPGVYGLEAGLLDNYENIQKFIKARSVAEDARGVSVSHLFLISPDLQDIDGVQNLLGLHASKKNFKYSVVMNLFREKPSREEIDERFGKLSDSLELEELRDAFPFRPSLDNLVVALSNVLEFRELCEVIPYLDALPKPFFNIEKIEQRFTVIPYLNWLRLFLNARKKRVSLGADAAWEKFGDSVNQYLAPMIKNLIG